MTFAHQIATRAAGGEVYVSTLRDPTDGNLAYVVGYSFGDGERSHKPKWLSRNRFHSVDQADAAAQVLADFLGCEVRV
jgi:hypothetical protein